MKAKGTIILLVSQKYILLLRNRLQNLIDLIIAATFFND